MVSWINVKLFLFLSIITTNVEIVIKFQNGRIRGILTTTTLGKEYLSFRGIYYAESPEGRQRFKPPIAKENLNTGEEIDGTSEGPLCVQVEPFSQRVTGKEDCLILNVYTPGYANQNVKTKYPVLVWIHGGGWRYGTSASSTYGPGRFIDEEVVVVSINYRVDSLGFLSTNDSAAPGNYGMLDQVEAFKWVRDNIHYFGGDANRVTLVGHSAGAASIVYHMLSPLSEGLFHRCIAMSGSPLSTWASVYDVLYWAKKLAMKVNCPVEDNVELVNCLREIDAYKLIIAGDELTFSCGVPFPPTVDGKFLRDNPRVLLANGQIYTKVPVITGITKDEGVGLFAISYRGLMEYSEEFVERSIKKTLNYHLNISHLAKISKEKYLNNVDVTDKRSLAIAISKFVTDAMYTSNYVTIQYLIAAGIKVYAYSFDFDGSVSVTQALIALQQRLGVGHCDDVFELFELGYLHRFVSDKEISNVMVSTFTNFAVSGNPNSVIDFDTKWPPVTQNEIPVLHIDKPIAIGYVNPKEDPRFDFWLRVVPETLMIPSIKKCVV